MLDIIYEDDQILVCRKPAGLAVQSASFGRRDLESMARTYLMEKNGKANPYLGVVHRLDQPVQGLVAFAVTPRAAASLSTQLQDGRMKKEYCAVVCGRLPQESGVLVNYLKKEPSGNCSRTAAKGTPGAKRAELSYRVLRECDGLSLVKIILKTGRHHQIRVQMAAAGAPIYGDGKYGAAGVPTYGDGKYGTAGAPIYGDVKYGNVGAPIYGDGKYGTAGTPAREGETDGPHGAGGGRNPHTLALCADRLEFFHPVTGKLLCFAAEPRDFPILCG